MDINTREITPDEFREYTGIDLEAELKPDGMPGSTAERFIRRNGLRMEAYLETICHRRLETAYRELNSFQKEKYKLALIEQSLYVFKNGDISTDSGYDPASGPKATPRYLADAYLAPNAKNYLLQAGIMSRDVFGKGRMGALPYGWWN